MDLPTYLREKGLWHRFVEKTETIHTSDASEATGIPLQVITKNLVSKTSEGEYALLIVPGDSRVNLQKAAEALEVSNVSLVPFSKAHEISGYHPGGTPSVGLKEDVRTVMDSGVAEMDTFYCGGGSRDRLLQLKTREIIKLTDAIVASISA
jgi:Cys-tRNA(Pro)/Cys-tRNA(Cys) deacylase